MSKNQEKVYPRDERRLGAAHTDKKDERAEKLELDRVRAHRKDEIEDEEDED